ncbi:MAG: hypothetical protein HC814_03830 [Rhodobacteraceae bacterium]|nr:hypothetical protein [Paracoccaceae bacterium]
MILARNSKFFTRAAAPDEKLIVAQMLGSGGDAGDGTVLHGPEFGVAVPAIEILAVEERLETVLSGNCGRNERNEGERGDE